MKHTRPDEETLAALLDGRLEEPERARVLRALADSPELLAEFQEAAAVVAAVEAGSTGHVASRIASPPSRWRRNALLAVPVLAAAAIAGVIVLREPTIPSVSLARSLPAPASIGNGSVERNLGGSWFQPLWAVNRGGADAGSDGTAIRAAARLVQLEFAAVARDSLAWRAVTNALVGQLGSTDVAGPLAATLDRETIANSSERESFARQLRALTGSPLAFDLGVWMESARLAAMLQRQSWFAPDGAAIGVLRDLLATDLPASLRAVTDLLAPLTGGVPDQGGLPATSARIDSAFGRIPR